NGTESQTKRSPLARASLIGGYLVSAAMASIVINPSAASEPDRLQFDAGDPGRDIQPGLALHAERLQSVGIGRTADQKIAAKADADRRVGADAAVAAGKLAASEPSRRRVHRPGKPGLV